MATISIADNDARVQYTQAVVANTTQLTIDFPFFSLDDINVIVTSAAGVDTTLTRGTGTGTFAVTGTSVDDGYSGGYVTLGDSYADASTKYTIFRDIDVERTTDFPTSGPFNISSLNTELDKIFAINQELETKIGRTLKLSDSDTSAELSLPNLDARKGTVLAFNTTTGLPEAGPEIGDVSTIAAITADISTLADIEDGTDATDAIQTVASISSNVTTVAGISSNVSTVAGISSDVSAVASDATDIGIVSTNIASVNTVASNITEVIAVANDLNEAVSEVETVANDLNEAVSEIETVAASISNVDTVGTNIADVNSVAGNSTNINTVAGISANVTTVAGISGNVTTVAGISSDVTAVAADATDIGTVSTNIANVNTVAGISSNVTTVAGNTTNINTVAGVSANVTTVAGVSSDVTAVAGQISPTNNVGTVAGIASDVSTVSGISANVTTVAGNTTNINTVAGISANVTTVAGISSDVTAVATDSTDIVTVATNLAGTDTIGTVATNISNVNTVAGISANVTTVAGISSDVTAVAADATDIGTVATNIANVNSVGGSISNVNTVASNISSVNDFADKYRIGASDPTTDNDEGDLFYNTTSDTLKVYTGTAWEQGVTAGSGFLPTTGGSMTGNVTFGDNNKAIFGAGSDLEIYHDGTKSVIADVTGAGNFHIRGSNVLYIQSDDGLENYAVFNDNGSASLYYDNSKKIETTSGGIDVTGTITFDGGTTTADLNFGDGDKAVFGAGSDLSIYHNGTHSFIAETNVGGNLYIDAETLHLRDATGDTWLRGVANDRVELYHNGSEKLRTTSVGIDVTGEVQADSLDIDGAADISGQVNFHSNVVWDDNNKLIIGNGSDLQIYHDGTDSVIKDTGTGNLVLTSNGGGIFFRNNEETETYANFNNNGSVQLRYDNGAKLETTATGIDVTGTVTADGVSLGDGEYIQLGASNDLQIYHDGSNSNIKDNGTGNLKLLATNFALQNSAANHNAIVYTDGGAVSIYHNNSKKFETSAAGAIVTGTLTATAFSGDGSGLTGVEAFPSGTLMLFQQTAAPTGWTKQTTHDNKALRVVTGTAGSGGSSAFTTAFGTPSVSGSVSLSGAPSSGNLAVSISGNIGDTTLSTAQIPSHSHSYQRAGNANNNQQDGSRTGLPYENANTGNAGGGGSHNHGHNLAGSMTGSPAIGNLAGSLSSSTASINVQYVDLIIASKD